MLRCNRRQAVCLAAVMGVALVLRVIALSTRGIWYDDAFSFFLARSGVDQIVAGTAADTMPPLYYFALHLWMGMGNDIIILRSLNVSVSLALVILVFQLGRLLFNFRTGVTAALLTAVSPFQIYHAQELRMYGLLCLSLLLYLHFFSHIYLSRDCCARHLWIGLIAAGALAIYSHNLAVFTVVAADLLLVLQQRWRFLGRLVLAQVGIVLLAAPWLVKVPGQMAKIQRAFWTPEPGPLQLVQALVVFHTDLPVPDWLIPVAVAMSTLFAMLGSYELLRRWRGDARVQLLAAFAYFPPLLMFVTSYVMRPVFVPRGFILSSVVYYLLFAVVLVGSSPSFVRGTLLVSMVLTALLALPSTYAYECFPRSPFRSAVEFLRPRLVRGDMVLHDNKLSYLPMRYYGPDLSQAFLPDEPGSHNDTLAHDSEEAMGIESVHELPEATEGATRVWFVFFSRSIEEWEERSGGHPTLEALGDEWRAVNWMTFNDLKVTLFERP